MKGSWWLLVAALVVGSCGGSKPVPQAPPSSSPEVLQPSEAVDLSPIAAPADLFLVGRLQRPGAVSDTLGAWAGLPTNLRSLLRDDFQGMDALIVWDAPVEMAGALAPESGTGGIRAVVSVGVTSVEAVARAARAMGRELTPLGPQLFSIGGLGGSHCAVGPAVGRAPARLVCGDRAADLDRLFAYARRGLPNENLGERDLEIELRAEPIRRRFGAELAGARLFAGFLLRQVELDSPRFDRVLADTVYGLADELVAIAEDSDSLRLRGSVDEVGKVFDLELTWRFRSAKSWTAAFGAELAGKSGPPPAAFFRLPSESTGGGYVIGVGPERYSPIRTSAIELADAYLEHEKIGKVSRDRVKRAVEILFISAVTNVHAQGELAESVRSKQSEAGRRLGWRVGRIERPLAEVVRGLGDMQGVLADRELVRLLAKRADWDPKLFPKATLGPAALRTLPKGSRALVMTVPLELVDRLQRRAAPARKSVDASKEPMRIAIAVAADGADATAFAVSSDPKDAAERLGAFLADGGPRLADRPELSSLKSARAAFLEFFTLASILNSLGANANRDAAKVGALLPNHGETPLTTQLSAERGPPVALSLRFTVPAAVFADLPALALAGFGVFASAP